MKRVVLLLLCVIGLWSCGNDPKESDEVSFDTIAIESEKDCDGLNCPLIKIDYPQLVTKSFAVEAINKHIEQAVVAVINSSPKDQDTSMSVEEAVNSFKAEFTKLRKDFPETEAGYEARIKGEVSYQSAQLISLKLNSFMYTGGAHGYTATRYININAKNGEVLSNAQLFTNREAVVAIAEKQFRAHEKIDDSVALNDAGYWFENDKYQLPLNIGFTNDQLVLFYNSYDVSPYSEGPIEIMIPLEKIREYLAYF